MALCQYKEHPEWVSKMMHRRAHVVLPQDLLADVDALVGPRGRSAFLAEVVREAVDRRRLLKMLGHPDPILRDEDYPEFHDGSEAWVRRLRDDDVRLDREKLGIWGAGGPSE